LALPHHAVKGGRDLARHDSRENLDFRAALHHLPSVGLDRSRPAFPRHFAQALHLSPLCRAEGRGECRSSRQVRRPAAAWSKPCRK
jgi:hypothetical protein